MTQHNECITKHTAVTVEVGHFRTALTVGVQSLQICNVIPFSIHWINLQL